MIIGGLDIGNGYVKGLVRNVDWNDTKPERVDMPSAVALISSPQIIPVTEEAAIKKKLDNIYNEMEMSIDSECIKDDKYKNKHLYTGTRAVHGGKVIYQFDVGNINNPSNHVSKMDQDLSIALTLSIFAGKILKDYYKKYNKLPENPVEETVSFAMSFPIVDYTDAKMNIEAKYTSVSHKVTIYDFGKPIEIIIHVKNVNVQPEGAVAYLAIMKKSSKFIQAIINDMEANGDTVDLPDGMTAEDIYNAYGVVGIDIGEGTVNFPIYDNRQLNLDLSRTLNKGYGHIMDQAVELLAAKNRPFKSRKQLIDWLNVSKDRPNLKKRREEVEEAINECVSIFVDELKTTLVDVFYNNATYAEVAYVFGGGANELRPFIYDTLRKTVADVFGNNQFPVLYLKSDYSRYLNRDGLYLIANANEDLDASDLNALYED